MVRNWAEGLSGPVTRELKKAMHRLRYPRGVVLYRQSDQACSLFLLLEGKVRLTVGGSSGKRIIVRLVSPSETFGLSSLLENSPYRATAESFTPCEVGHLPRSEFVRLRRRFPELDAWAADQLISELHQTLEVTANLATAPSMEAKLVYLVLLLAGNPKRSARRKQLVLPITQEEAALQLGVPARASTGRCRDCGAGA